ncbi:unnamed protein product [Kuraishia capsulata CBS 1993]|uniref:Fe2OG dioxygenase domain-containing protein n=1 Tax=Kuraishia capsulata CBS 1993 TaxID=1382522 RepID=W6MVI5_9ASCO|nr:uncharacterized protein KUCA_T00002281001 [Kuraishia capsulata CBS 1993]CDK26310.1 unnamed protein product [Kuraishia capsulata CBS 1993]
MIVPILDLSQAFDKEARSELILQLRDALLSVGFFYVTNVPIDDHPGLLQSLTSQATEFFALPSESKSRLSMANSPHFLGYSGFASEITANARDLREHIELATELPAPPKSTLTKEDEVWRNLEGPNQWPEPEQIPQFRPVVERYISETSKFARWFISLVAEALSLDPSAFDAFFKPNQQCKMKLVKYPESGAHPDGVHGCGAHRDSNFLTYLYQATPHVSLQIQDRLNSGAWVDVPPIPDTLVVAVGQTLEYITKGVCTATVHRVLAPEPGIGDRLSVPFFQTIDAACVASSLEIPEELLRLRDARTERGEKIGFQFAADGSKPVGWTVLLNRIKSHRDVAQRWYPELLAYVLAQV